MQSPVVGVSPLVLATSPPTRAARVRSVAGSATDAPQTDFGFAGGSALHASCSSGRSVSGQYACGQCGGRGGGSPHAGVAETGACFVAVSAAGADLSQLAANGGCVPRWDRAFGLLVPLPLPLQLVPLPVLTIPAMASPYPR